MTHSYTKKSQCKFRAKWEELFIIEYVYSNSAYHLAKLDGELLMMPINDKVPWEVLFLTF